MKHIVLTLIAVLALAACGGSPAVQPPPEIVRVMVTPEPVAATPEPTPEPVVTPEPTEEPTEEPTPEPVPALVPLGTAATAGELGEWKIKITGKPNFDAWKVVKRENMFNTPAPSGWKMVLIPVSFTNVSGEKDDLLGLGEYVYGEATGVERTDFEDPICGVIPKDIDFFQNVRPGGTIKGNMCFVVEKEDIPTLRFAVPAGMFSDEDVEFALR